MSTTIFGSVKQLERPTDVDTISLHVNIDTMSEWSVERHVVEKAP
jgi:hypothetical protein